MSKFTLRISKGMVTEEDNSQYGAQIVSTLSTQLTWSHIIEILPLKEALQREFYLAMASSNRWSVCTLRHYYTRLTLKRSQKC